MHGNQWILLCFFWPFGDRCHTEIQSRLLLTEGYWFLISLGGIHVAWHTQCHYPIHCFCDISLAHGQHNTTFFVSIISSHTTDTLSPLAAWLSHSLPVSSDILIAWECLLQLLFALSFSFSHSLTSAFVRPRSPSFTYKTLPMHKRAFTCMQHARTQTCTHTIDGNLACVITATLSCLGVLSHLALVFAASPLPLTPPHPTPHKSPLSPSLPPVHPPPSTLPTHRHTQRHTHTEQRRSKRDDNPA